MRPFLAIVGSPMRVLLCTALIFGTQSLALTELAGGQEKPGTEGSRDPVVELQRRIDAGEVTLSFDSERGYLRSVLEALEIPASSQGLVFSRTSLQTDRISPWTPRALYFNDDVYVGWVQESPILEIASVDPDSGAAFYTLPQTETERPRFVRESTTCLMCHESKVTRGVPGFIIRSVLTDRHGYVISSVHEGATTDRTPLDARWGGWYVTGTQAEGGHAGNTAAPLLFDEVADPRRYLDEMDFMAGSNVTALNGRFDPQPYLTEHSDLVAIMVLTHQARIHNQITYAVHEANRALADQETVFRATGEVPESGLLPSTRVRVDNAALALVKDLFFVGEAALPGPVRGTSDFAVEFSARGPADSKGRSLRELDLTERLFRYPLSFLVYSEAFASMPPQLAETVRRRIQEVLRGEDDSGDFDHLTEEDRTAIAEILAETLPELAPR